MKKLVLVLAAMAIAVCANAQIYLGGSLHFQASDNISTNFTIKPEVGYSFNDSMAVGASLGLGFYSHNTLLTFSPYFRWSFVHFGPASLFLDGGFDMGGIIDERFRFAIGVRPGIAFHITDHLSAVGHLGFLGYTNDVGNIFTSENILTAVAIGLPRDGFRLDLSGNTLSVGLYYNF